MGIDKLYNRYYDKNILSSHKGRINLMSNVKDELHRQLLEYLEEVEAAYRACLTAEAELNKKKTGLEETIIGLKQTLKLHLERTGQEDNSGPIRHVSFKTANDSSSQTEGRNNSLESEFIRIAQRYESILPNLPLGDKFRYLSVPSAAIEFFLEHDNKASTAMAILTFIQWRGIVIGGKDPNASITAVLHGDKRFIRVARGRYQLDDKIYNNLKASGHRLEWKLEEVRQ